MSSRDGEGHQLCEGEELLVEGGMELESVEMREGWGRGIKLIATEVGESQGFPLPPLWLPPRIPTSYVYKYGVVCQHMELMYH